MCSRRWLIVALVACVWASACSNYNTNLSIQTSSSVLTFVSPGTATVGSQGFTIMANGSGFATGALILWNGTALTTTLVSVNQLTAPVPASDLTTAGTVKVSVQIPGSAQSATSNVNNTTTTEVSNIVLFTINTAPGPSPSIASLSASTTSAASTPYCSSQGFTLTVNGTNFTSDAVVNWNGAAQTTTFVSATQVTAPISAVQAGFPGTASVTVTNSIGASSSLPFTLSTPSTALATPSISSLSQTSAAAGSPALTLTVTGTNLLPCSEVQWVNVGNVTSSLTTTYVSATQLSATIPAADFVAMGNAQVEVFTLGPGGGTSGQVQFTIAPPTITSLSSSTTSSNTTPSCSPSGFTLTVNGSNFVNGSVVDWNGSARGTAFVSSTQLTAAILFSDIASAGSASITVSNSGVSSAPASFTISASTLPAAVIASISPAGATAGTVAFPLSITGSNFLPCSSVQWVDSSNNLTQLATTYVNPTQLTATVTSANLTSAQTVQVTVANPALSANLSNAIAFPIVLPTITSLSGSTTSSNTTPACSPAGITLTVNGANFVPNGLVVNWNGSPRQTAFVNATQLTAAISATDTAFPGPATVTVSSSTIPSLSSTSSTFTVTPSTTPLPAPVITTLMPSNAAAGSTAFMLGVDASGASGGSLAPCSVVQWNGSPRTTTFTGPTGVNAAISAADVATAASIPVNVFTLTDGGGGGTSNALTFTVFTPPAVPVARIASVARSAAGAASTAVGEPSLATPSMSADKRYTVLVLASTDGMNEVPGTPKNIFVRDTCTGAPSGCSPSVTPASIGLNSNPADGDSISPSISADGRFVVFLSSAMNLVDSDTNGVTDVFVRDTCAGAPSGCSPSTQRVSIATDGTQANGASTSATISATGRYITFESEATNLAPTSSSTSGIFLRDTCIGALAGCTPSTQPLN
jgi:trimeric autotransporter adhesin